MRAIIAVVLLGAFTCAHADDCESVVALSKITSSMVQDKDSVEQNAANFCSEYSKRNTNYRSANFGASYKFLSASMGRANASEEDVASKYCSASSNYSQSRDAYKQYIESISPGAYSAYEQCLAMRNQDLRFNLNTASVLPTEFSMSVGFVSSVGRPSDVSASASVLYSASEGVSCQWNGSKERSIVIPTRSTVVFECKRDDPSRKSFVSIVRTDAGRDAPLTLPWQAYDTQGNPIDALAALQERLRSLEISVAQSEKDSVVGFESDKCPEGWSEVPEARGRFLRGIDSSGSTAIDPDGRRQPGAIQNDLIGKHTHAYSSGFHSGQSNSGTGYDPNKKDAVLAKTDEGNSITGEPLGSETRPKNIAVLFCTK